MAALRSAAAAAAEEIAMPAPPVLLRAENQYVSPAPAGFLAIGQRRARNDGDLAASEPLLPPAELAVLATPCAAGPPAVALTAVPSATRSWASAAPVSRSFSLASSSQPL